MATERVEDQKEIGVRDLLTSVYNNILQKYPQVKLTFDKPLESLVADDGDHHDWGRKRQGWMIYENVAIVKIGTKKWLFALATKVEGYAGSNYSCDLKAFETAKKTILGSKYEVELRREMYNRHYFKDSILAGAGYGGILKIDYPNWAPLSMPIAEKLGSDFESLVARPPEMDSGYLSLASYGAPLSWAIKSTLKFKSEAADRVSQAVLEVLEENKT